MSQEAKKIEPIFYDTETCGLYGPVVLIQYAIGDGPIILHSVWTTPIIETLKLIEMFMEHEGGLCGFNLAFDHFHLCQLYTTLLLSKDWESDPKVEEYALNEPKARDGPCLKPKTALDLLLHARKGPYQSCMEREDIRIKKVPTQLAYRLATELEKRVPLKSNFFARRKNKNAPKWNVYDIEETNDFKDVVLKFAPSSALKALSVDALGLDPDEVLYFADVELDGKLMPTELGYAPYALAVGTPKDWKGAWPEKINEHIIHWGYHETARKYASKDVELTRRLFDYFGRPAFGDVDSLLACAVGSIRWRGYRVDLDKIKALRHAAMIRESDIPQSPNSVMAWINPVLTSDVERTTFTSTAGRVLEDMEAWDLEPCKTCLGEGKIGKMDCEICDGKGKVHAGKNEAGRRAGLVIQARKASKEVQLYDKILVAGRFHASFNVIGTLSGRMSGSDGLNPQGIKAADSVRSAFLLAWEDQLLTGGDFAGFEVVLADAVYADPDLRRDLTEIRPCTNCDATGKKDGEKCKVCDGKGKGTKKIHALFGQYVFKDMTYDEIVASAGGSDDVYSKAKRAVFAMLYGGEGHTLKERLGVPIDVAEEAYQAFINKYKQVGVERRKVFTMFCSMRQPGGLGSRVEWHEPADFIESIFGFKRYFTLENKICKVLFELANEPPKEWTSIKIKVVRRDRLQTASGATRSALFGAAFAIQAQNMRSAANHVIQSSGAFLTKELQCEIWNQLQPAGVHTWVVMPMNIHDEIMNPSKDKEKIDKVIAIKDKFIAKHKEKVPLIKIDWKETMHDWSGKH